MSSLPPKPLDPQREERHHSVDDKDSHPTRIMTSQSRFRERPLSSNDRVYVPRTRPSEYDSYVAPVYDRRRDDDVRRRDYVDRERDRGRGVWERTGDIRDRERGSRFVEPSPEHDRDRRGYTRERGYDRDRTHYSPRDRHRDSYDRRDHRSSSPIRPGTFQVRHPERLFSEAFRHILSAFIPVSCAKTTDFPSTPISDQSYSTSQPFATCEANETSTTIRSAKPPISLPT